MSFSTELIGYPRFSIICSITLSGIRPILPRYRSRSRGQIRAWNVPLPTRGQASRQSSCRSSSNASTAWRRRVLAITRTAARGWDSPSRAHWSTLRVGTSAQGVSKERGQRSRFGYPKESTSPDVGLRDCLLLAPIVTPT